MLPILNDGDLVITTPYLRSKDELQAGMVIRFWETEGRRTIHVLHRIVEVSNHGIITMGDNNGGVPDGLIGHEQVISVYRFKIPLHKLGMGQITSFLSSVGELLTNVTKVYLPLFSPSVSCLTFKRNAEN